MRYKPGFTLVELLIVIFIIALAMAMVSASLTKQNKDANVLAAAEMLAGTLRRTRSMAMENGAPYAVVFNIQNAPDSSGKILNNRSGDHWYRILGPAKEMTAAENNSGTSTRRLLIPYRHDMTYDYYGVFIATLPHYIETLKEYYIGEPISLPARKVRFLALSETDEGHRVYGSSDSRNYLYPSTYPRPYFGYYDTATQRLFPWGGYNPDIAAADPWKNASGTVVSTNYTGFFYEGKDGTITGCRNPSDRVYQVDWNRNNSFGGTDVRWGSENAYYVLRKDDPRPLVNGRWADFLVAFSSDGNAYVPPFGVARKRYMDAQSAANTALGNGVFDMTRSWANESGITGGTTSWNDYWSNFNGWASVGNAYNEIDTSEFGHFPYHLGGWHITLAPDSIDDQDVFPSATQALESISPMYRVFVSRKGAIEVIRVQSRQDGGLDGKTPFPTNKSFFLGNTTGGAYGDDRTYMKQHFRFGWLHTNTPRNGSGTLGTSVRPELLAPSGQPISYLVTNRMLTDKIWWIE